RSRAQLRVLATAIWARPARDQRHDSNQWPSVHGSGSGGAWVPERAGRLRPRGLHTDDDEANHDAFLERAGKPACTLAQHHWPIEAGYDRGAGRGWTRFALALDSYRRAKRYSRKLAALQRVVCSQEPFVPAKRGTRIFVARSIPFTDADRDGDGPSGGRDGMRECCYAAVGARRRADAGDVGSICDGSTPEPHHSATSK